MRYIRPLWEHFLSLDSAYPLGALYFIGLLTYNPTGTCNYAQAKFAAHTIADPALFDTREELYDDLLYREECARHAGLDPFRLGHKPFVHKTDDAPYPDRLVEYLQRRGLGGKAGIPPWGTNFTEPWRTWGLRHGDVRTYAWQYIEGQGEDVEREWEKGKATERDYANLMEKLVDWWAKETDKKAPGVDV